MRELFFCIIIACSLRPLSVEAAQLESYVWSTIAGLPGQEGNVDGTNSEARFSTPRAIAVDAAGNLYVTDRAGDTVREVRPVGSNWVVRTLAGMAGVAGSADGTNSDARFNQPEGIAVDGAGNLYVADGGNTEIRKLTQVGTNWVVSTLAGLPGASGAWWPGRDGTNTDARFCLPTGIALDEQGNIYVTDLTSTIRRMTPSGTNWVVTTIAGTPGTSGDMDGTGKSARFFYPSALAIDRSRSLYLVDSYNNEIRKIVPAGTNWIVSTLAGAGPYGYGSSDGINGAAQFSSPWDITLDNAGKLYVTDSVNQTIRRVTPVGGNWVVTTEAGVAGVSGDADGIGRDARFNRPMGIARDSTGNLYVADWINRTIRMGRIAFSLQSTLSANELVLSWSLMASNYVLEASSSLSAEAAWTPLTNGVMVSGESFTLTNAPGTSVAFYRLRKQ